jgi:hypothetical protein
MSIFFKQTGILYSANPYHEGLAGVFAKINGVVYRIWQKINMNVGFFCRSLTRIGAELDAYWEPIWVKFDKTTGCINTVFGTGVYTTHIDDPPNPCTFNRDFITSGNSSYVDTHNAIATVNFDTLIQFDSGVPYPFEAVKYDSYKDKIVFSSRRYNNADNLTDVTYLETGNGKDVDVYYYNIPLANGKILDADLETYYQYFFITSLPIIHINTHYYWFVYMSGKTSGDGYVLYRTSSLTANNWIKIFSSFTPSDVIKLNESYGFNRNTNKFFIIYTTFDGKTKIKHINISGEADTTDIEIPTKNTYFMYHPQKAEMLGWTRTERDVNNNIVYDFYTSQDGRVWTKIFTYTNIQTANSWYTDDVRLFDWNPILKNYMALLGRKIVIFNEQGNLISDEADKTAASKRCAQNTLRYFYFDPDLQQYIIVPKSSVSNQFLNPDVQLGQFYLTTPSA